jgi:hypothetical protein
MTGPNPGSDQGRRELEAYCCSDIHLNLIEKLKEFGNGKAKRKWRIPPGPWYK